MNIMSDEYILIKMSEHPKEFRCPFSGVLLGIQIRGSIKIDTGAGSSLFPLRTLQFANALQLSQEANHNFYSDLKKSFLSQGLKPGFLRGVEHTGDIKPEINLYDRKDLTFRTDIKSFVIDKYPMPNVQNIRITCDTTGNVLLGMDILSQFDFHCGISNFTAEYIFLGCLRSQITPAYLSALKTHFNYGS